MRITMLTYKGYSTYKKESGSVCYGKIEGIDDLVTFQCDSECVFEEEFQKAVDDYLDTCEREGKTPCVPCLRELEQSVENTNMKHHEEIFVGHNYGAATWIQAAMVDISERIEFSAVHEVGMEVSVDKDVFDKEFKNLFLIYFDSELVVNKNRFTRAFSDEGRYLTRYESDVLEPNFFTKSSIVEISDELEKRGK